MTKEVEKFFNNNPELFKQGDMARIYNTALQDYEMMTYTWSLTELFYSSGIDPLTFGPKENRLTTIPDYYLAYSDIVPKEIPEGILYIGRAAFAATGGFRHINLPNTLKEIGVQAFSHSNLEEITIPASTFFINSQAFQGCSLLKKVTILGTHMKFGNDVFSKCPSLRVIETKDPNIGGVVPLGCKVKHI